MNKGLIGKKIGMTQIFDESGKVIPVTVIEAGPCVVAQVKTEETEKVEEKTKSEEQTESEENKESKNASTQEIKQTNTNQAQQPVIHNNRKRRNKNKRRR